MKPKLSAFNYFPFLRFTLVFIAGVITENSISHVPSWAFMLLLLPIIILAFVTFLIKLPVSKSYLTSITILFSFFIAGFLYSNQFKQRQFSVNIPTEGTYAGIVQDKAPSTKNRMKYTVGLECVMIENKLSLIDEKIIVYSADSLANSLIEPGNEIIFEARLNEILKARNPGEFDFQRYMLLRGIRYQAYINDDIFVTATHRKNLKTMALNLRSRLMSLYREAGIDGDEYAVLGALTLGDKNYISNEVKSSFSASGAMHVLSVSGLHVGIIFLVLNLLLKPLNNKKKWRVPKVLILLGSLWLYAFITGLSPSVLRSTSMFSFIIIGENINRKTNTYNTLAVSAFLLMLFNPLIIYEVGFQLSYMAVTSIVFFQPKFTQLVKTKTKVGKYLWDLATVSLAAQLGTTPISLYYFHQFPTYFLLSNFIVVPAAALILYLGVIFFATSFIPIVSHIIALILKSIVWGLNFSVKTIEALPGSVVENIALPPGCTIILYLIIVFVSTFLLLKKGRYLLYSLASITFLFVSIILTETRELTQKKLIIYNNRTEPLISYIIGKEHYYYTTTDTLSHYSEEMLNSSSLKYGTGKPILLTKHQNEKSFKKKKEILIDELITVSNNKKYAQFGSTGNNLIHFTFPEMLVTFKKHDFIQKKANTKSDASNNNSYNIKNDGALVINLR